MWNDATQRSFDALKSALTAAPLLQVPDFTFELNCDASSVGIGGVLSQEGKSIAFFCEKLNPTKMRYCTYDL